MDFELWDQPLDFSKPVPAKAETTYFAQCMMEYIWFEKRLEAWREEYREDFKDWTKAHFDNVNRAFKKRMSQLLVSKGIPSTKESLSAQFVKLLEYEMPDPTLRTDRKPEHPGTQPYDYLDPMVGDGRLGRQGFPTLTPIGHRAREGGPHFGQYTPITRYPLPSPFPQINPS